MIYITQLIYIHNNQASLFNEFESIAIPIICKYGGNLELRLRPEPTTIIDSTLEEKPYEIHIVSFPSEEKFKAFLEDEERNKYVHLKEKSIKAITVIKGKKI